MFDDNVWPWLYLKYESIAARKLNVEDVAKVASEWLVNRTGFVEAAFTRKELDDPAPAPDKPLLMAAKLSYRPDRCGDIIVIPKAGVLVTKYPAGTTHGTPQPYDTHIPFLVYGAQVPALGRAQGTSVFADGRADARVGAGRARAEASRLVPARSDSGEEVRRSRFDY